jgi:hypothetical protein
MKVENGVVRVRSNPTILYCIVLSTLKNLGFMPLIDFLIEYFTPSYLLPWTQGPFEPMQK